MRPGARDAVVMRSVYDELLALAAPLLRDAGLRTTELISEAHRRLAARDPSARMDRIRFKAIAARAIRKVLVDDARKRHVVGGPLRAHWLTLDLRIEELIALDDALGELGTFAERCAHAIELSCFGGMTRSEIATVLEVSVDAVRRDLDLAEAWVHRAAQRDPVI